MGLLVLRKSVHMSWTGDLVPNPAIPGGTALPFRAPPPKPPVSQRRMIKKSWRGAPAMIGLELCSTKKEESSKTRREWVPHVGTQLA